ncbi:hypothetical protein QO179_24925 [Bacillus stercoris]|nr:hypothetical protein [Bacillus stercoris]
MTDKIYQHAIKTRKDNLKKALDSNNERLARFISNELSLVELEYSIWKERRSVS